MIRKRNDYSSSMTSVYVSENDLLWRVYDFSRNAQVLNWKVNVARKPKTIIFPQITSIKNSPSEILRKQSTICDCGMVLFEAFENYGFIFWKRLETIRRCVNPVEVCYIHTHSASAIAFSFESVFGANLFFFESPTQAWPVQLAHIRKMMFGFGRDEHLLQQLVPV